MDWIATDLDSIGLDSDSSDSIGLDWIQMDWIATDLDSIGLDSDSIGLDWI